jgi:hypothetical protein
MSMKYKKDPTSKSYSVPHNTRIGSGALGNTTDKLKTRKPPGYIKSKPMVPHTRGS